MYGTGGYRCTSFLSSFYQCRVVLTSYAIVDIGNGGYEPLYGGGGGMATAPAGAGAGAGVGAQAPVTNYGATR